MKRDYEFAFPQTQLVDLIGGQDTKECQVGGMHLRDWFAGQALAGLLASCDVNGSSDFVVPEAYRLADLMMEQRDKS